jgi:hypothetical protein
MSKEAVEAVIGRALLCDDFRMALLADAEQALAGFKLTKEEGTDLRRLDGETLDTLAKCLDEQIKKLHLKHIDYNATTPKDINP